MKYKNYSNIQTGVQQYGRRMFRRNNSNMQSGVQQYGSNNQNGQSGIQIHLFIKIELLIQILF